MWKPNKHKGIELRWGEWNKALWDGSRGGSASWGTTNTQARSLGRWRTTNESRSITKTYEDNSNSKGKITIDAMIRSKTT